MRHHNVADGYDSILDDPITEQSLFQDGRLRANPETGIDKEEDGKFACPVCMEGKDEVIVCENGHGQCPDCDQEMFIHLLLQRLQTSGVTGNVTPYLRLFWGELLDQLPDLKCPTCRQDYLLVRDRKRCLVRREITDE